MPKINFKVKGSKLYPAQLSLAVTCKTLGTLCLYVYR